MAKTGASANASGCNKRIKLANVLMVGMHRRLCATNGAGIGVSAFGW